MVWAIDFRSLTGNILNGIYSGPPTRMSSKMGEAFDEIYSLATSITSSPTLRRRNSLKDLPG